MEILVSIAAKIGEYTVDPVGRQVRYLLFYKDTFKELNDQVEELKLTKERNEHAVESVRRSGRQVENNVQKWRKEVDEILKEARELCEDPRHAYVGCSKWSFPDIRSRYQLSRNASKIAKHITKLQEDGKFGPGEVGYLPPRDTINFISAPRGSEKLESRNLMMEDIVMALRDPKLSKIGVYGLSGVGKTTLVREVAKKIKDDELFDEVAMVTISQTPDIERIQGEIADHLGLRFEEMTKFVGKASRLCERIKMAKTILIILDDVWVEIDLEKLGIPSKDNHKGCKLLLTSRNRDILQKMESEKDFRLEALDEQETCKLFQAVTGDAFEDANLRNIATQVAKRCPRLPVLIVTMAKSLKNKDIHHWKDALNTLEKSGRLDDKASLALEFSYRQLDGDEAKAIFLHCGVHGTFIWIEYLLKCVIGLGIFKHINTVDDARNRLYKIIDDLKASCLVLEDGANVSVRLHDIVRDVAISIACRDQNIFTKKDDKLIDWPSEGFLQRCSQIILSHCCIQNLPKRLDCPNLKFLYLNSNDNRILEIPHSFFEGMGNLEVLDLTGLIISSLPASLASLTKLKTLCLDQCSLKDMAGIGALKSLEILSFVNSSFEDFPSEIGQLTHLRMLDLNDSGIKVIPPNIMSQLTKLEELYMANMSIKWGVESSGKQNTNASLAELKHLKNLIALEIQIGEAWNLPRDITFEKLERYKILIGDKWEWSDMNGASRLLKLKLDTNIPLEHGIKTLLESVENLYLDGISGISNVLYQLHGEGFPQLKLLSFQNNAEIQHIINSTERNQTHRLFPNLETMILHNLENLKKICHGPLMVGSFRKLKVIKVKSCDQLEYLFFVSMVKEFSQLLEIEVCECSSMKNIVCIKSTNSCITIDKIEFISLRTLTLQRLPAMDGLCSNEVNSLRSNLPTSFFNAKVNFLNLETLKLSSTKLEKIWDDNQRSVIQSFQNLVNFTLEKCGGLKYLLSSSMIGSLSNLKRLEISECDMLEEIIATMGRNDVALQEVQFSNLETIIISNMKSLKKVWHSQFEGLKTLEVNNCEKLENIFPSYMQRTFGNLETLKVSNCGLVEEIFELTTNEVQSKTELKKLYLLNLPKLKQIWSFDLQETILFHNLQDIHVEGCGKIEFLFPFSIAKDLLQLEKLYMDACGMKEIVSKKEEHMEGKATFDFHQLYHLEIVNMLELERFYAGNHILACPSLRILRVYNCAKLKLFETWSKSQCIVSMQQCLFIVEEVIPNLEELSLSSKDAKKIMQDQQWRFYFRKLKLLRLYGFDDKLEAETFLDSILQNAPNIDNLVVRESSLKVIFQEERLAWKDGKNEFSTQIKKLGLHTLQELRHICREGCQIDPILEVLELLHVSRCASLKNLVPSSVTFSHLKYLTIENCNGLTSLISSSTARTLVKLEWMKIKECNSLEEMVTQEVNEMKDEIVFNSLVALELEGLPRFNSFSCSKCFFKFPLLKFVAVRQCPMMKNFSARETSTPMLRKVLGWGKGKNWCWEGDLNQTIEKMFQDKVEEEEGAGREGDGGNYMEPLSNVSESAQPHQGTSSSNRALISEEHVGQSKTNQDVEVPNEREQKEQDSSADPSSIPKDQERILAQTVQNADKSHDSNICDGENLLNQPTTSTTTDNRETIDPTPSQAQEEAMASQSHGSSSYKQLIDISVKNLSYLEAGLKRHPQVLEWLNSKRGRVFAPLFAEVTRLLRTTRRGNLTEDDRNYIKDCCSCLDAVGFDASWLNYVYRCLEECGDGENLRRMIEEAKDKASTLKKELASVEASLELMEGKASRLDNFIEP